MISQDIRSNRDRYLAIMAEHGTLAPEDIVVSVGETQADLHAVFSSASVEVAARKPAPDEWCLLELARHAAFTERLVVKLIHHLARGAYPSAEDFEGAGIGMMPDDDRGYAEVLDDLALKNATLLDEIRDLPDAPNVEMKADHPFFGPLNCKECRLPARPRSGPHPARPHDPGGHGGVGSRATLTPPTCGRLPFSQRERGANGQIQHLAT